MEKKAFFCAKGLGEAACLWPKIEKLELAEKKQVAHWVLARQAQGKGGVD
jgi:hypothetical protein